MMHRPMTGPSAPEPLEHSVLDEDLDGRPMEGMSVPEPLDHSVLVGRWTWRGCPFRNR